MVSKKSKILLILIIFILAFNVFSPIVLAEEEETDLGGAGGSVEEIVGGGEQALEQQNSKEPTFLGKVADWGAGLAFSFIKYPAYWITKGIHTLTESVATSDTGKEYDVTPETILFNKLPITNINFFDTNESDVSFVNSLRKSVASWFTVMQTIAIIASVSVLIYIAIRMATSTIASDKAEYKRMLTDWAVGFAIVFLLPFIIIFVIYGNNVIVDILDGVKYSTVQSAGETLEENKINSFIDELENEVVWHIDFSKSIGALLVYIMFVGLTIAFLIMYIKRMIVVAFLIIISPLITITYAIDKVKDNKSQALDSWLKEFVWTILVQPFHCVIFIVFVSISLTALKASTLSASVLAIMSMMFVLQAEDIIKKIFGIQADNIGKMSSSFALATGGILFAQKFAGNKAKQGAKKATGAASSYLTKIKDKKGEGIAETNDGKPTTFTQKAANTFAKAVSSPKVEGALNKFNNFMEDNKYGKAMAGTAKVMGSALSKGYDVGAGVVGVGLSLPNAKGLGDVITGAGAGYAAGQALKQGAKWVGKKATVDVIESGRTRNAIANLNESYRQMKAAYNLTDEKMQDMAKEYIKLDLKDSAVLKNLDPIQRAYAHNLQTLMKQLEKAGEDNSTKSVLGHIKVKNTIDDVNNGTQNNNNGNS